MEGRNLASRLRVADRVGMALITTILGYGSTQVSELNKTVQSLSQNVAVMVVRYETQSQEIIEIKHRILSLEARR